MLKKKLKWSLIPLSVVSVLVCTSSFTEETESGGSVYKCEAPLTNTCYNIYKNGVLIATEKGVIKF